MVRPAEALSNATSAIAGTNRSRIIRFGRGHFVERGKNDDVRWGKTSTETLGKVPPHNEVPLVAPLPPSAGETLTLA
jgi:hypothetical protein